jgi:multiple sugar transport system ATP-binding protein
MATVRYDKATRLYTGTTRPAVDALALDITDGEPTGARLPPGSGKSTALRMLAGLEDVDAGALFIGERT